MSINKGLLKYITKTHMTEKPKKESMDIKREMQMYY
jgi:hypothetical protein